MEFDWTPYFGNYSMESLVLVGAAGAMGLAPLVVMRIAYRWALDLAARVASSILR